ncbi:hypothetical protein ACFL30_03020 [Candidatus Latescibacterota bacterium]
MKKIFLLCNVFIAAFCTLLTSCSEKTAKSGQVTIVYTGNIGARYDPCGCRIPLGGLARRSTAVNEIRDLESNVIILDSGALLYEKHRLYPPYEPVLRQQARLMVDMLNKIGLDASNVSSMDLANSPDSLLTIDKISSWPWLSANVVWKETGNLIFQPDMIKTTGNMNVGIFGFMDQSSNGTPFFDESSPVDILDPVETAKKEVKKLKAEGVDLVVALIYMNKDDVENLIRSVPGINLAIYSHTNEHNPSSDPTFFVPYKVNDTVVARCPDGGRVVGIMKLEMWNGSTDFTNGVKYVDLRPESVKKAEDIKDRKSNFTNVFINLDPSISRDREIQDYIDEVGGRLEASRERLKKETEKS